MAPLFLTLHTNRKIMVLPDTLAHLNGHTVITKSYTIFRDPGFTTSKQIQSRLNEELLETVNDPDYLGILKFELPDKLFSYASGAAGLDAEEVNELIELLSGIRNNPASW